VSATGVIVVAVWAASGSVLVAAGRARLGAWVIGGAAVGAVAVWGAEHAPVPGALAAAMVPAAVGCVALALPDGRLGVFARRLVAVVLVVGGLVVGIAFVVADEVPSGLLVGAASAAVVVLIAPSVRRRSRRAALTDRPLLLFATAGVVTTAAVALVAGAVALLADHDVAREVMVLSAALPALALAAGALEVARRSAPPAVAASVVLASVAVVVVLGQGVAVLVAGRLPTGDERALVVPSFVAAIVATFAIAPVRRTASAFATRWVFGTRRRPEDAGRTLTERASEGVPVDELLLQLADSLRWALGAHQVEVWTRATTAFERVASVPEQPAAALMGSDVELAALARTAVVGDAWIELWMPRLLTGRDGMHVRVAPAVHTGAALGFVLVQRPAEDRPFSEQEDRALAELGRRLGEVLNARRLDAALTATLDDLRASRSRLVAAADAERRRIERDLHDGAQQHLVALAVSLRVARDLVGTDPAASIELLDELTIGVQDTIQDLRDLARGIYPPLLVDAGLPDALRAAAQRSPLDVRVDAVAGRHRADVEAAVYFCCLEALQNAAKHAPDATVQLRLWEEDGVLRFEISDDGPGFDRTSTAAGLGFHNMADRLGAIGGRVEWDAAPGRGTRVVGEVAP
jgi:signal transduction histidine kinase